MAQDLSCARIRPLALIAALLVTGESVGQSKKQDKQEEKAQHEPFSVRRITQGMGLQRIGPLSPDGKSILLLGKKPDSSPNLYVMDVDTFAIRRPLTNFAWGATDPVWSPTGDAVALAGYDETASFSEVYVVDVGTGKTRRLTRNSFTDKEPVFTPDGKRFLYTTDESPLPDAAFGILHVASVSAAGGKPEPFTEDEGSSIHPGISADRTAVLLVKVDELSGRHSLWEYGFDGKPRRSLTQRKLARIHSYVPRGGSIILWAQEDPEQQEFVFVLDTGSGEILSLPDPDTPKGSPALSPDGRLVAYVSPGPRGTCLFLYDMGSSRITQLTTRQGRVFSPRFISNTAILFGSDRDRENEIYLVDLATPAGEDKKEKKR